MSLVRNGLTDSQNCTVEVDSTHAQSTFNLYKSLTIKYNNNIIWTRIERSIIIFRPSLFDNFMVDAENYFDE